MGKSYKIKIANWLLFKGYHMLPSFQLLCALSLDGSLADVSGNSTSFTSQADKQWLQNAIAEADVLVMGHKTYKAHSPKNNRKSGQSGNSQYRIVFSRSVSGVATLNEYTFYFNDSPDNFLHFCDLHRWEKVLVLGGADIYRWFFENRLVHKVFITLEPVFLPGGKSFIGANFWSQHGMKLQLASVTRLNDRGSLLLEYSI